MKFRIIEINKVEIRCCEPCGHFFISDSWDIDENLNRCIHCNTVLLIPTIEIKRR